MKIAVFCKAPFPEGTAASTYVLNVCRVMQSCGHEVTVFGCLRNKPARFPVNGEIDGIAYRNFPAFQKNKLLVYLYDNCWGEYIVNTLSRQRGVDIAFLCGGLVKEAKKVNAYCKRKGILYGAFNSEWYTPESFSSSVKKSYVEQATGLIPYNATHADVAIQISTLLTEHFQKNGVRTVMMPNIVDLTDPKWNGRKSAPAGDILKLAYAGVPGVGKDELGTVIEAMTMLPEAYRKKVELNIYGPTQAKLQEYLNMVGVAHIPDTVICHGRKNQNEIPALLNDCHYTVLIRKPSLRTNAGFSTKMVESFAAGLPMIANVTGDIGTYLKDGVNGVVVADDTAQACRDALIRAVDLLPSNQSMRQAAIATAQEHFDYRGYIGQMQQFLQSVKKN